MARHRGRHIMTSARKAALRKAQLASARSRRKFKGHQATKRKIYGTRGHMTPQQRYNRKVRRNRRLVIAGDTALVAGSLAILAGPEIYAGSRTAGNAVMNFNNRRKFNKIIKQNYGPRSAPGMIIRRGK